MADLSNIMSTGPISQAVFYPEIELVSFNGFAWSNKQGIIHQSQTNTIPINPMQWFGTQE